MVKLVLLLLHTTPPCYVGGGWKSLWESSLTSGLDAWQHGSQLSKIGGGLRRSDQEPKAGRSSGALLCASSVLVAPLS